MHEIYFYRDKNGRSQVEDYLAKLMKSKNKDSQVKLKKILDYLEMLGTRGIKAGQPYIKHIQGKIWELRPLRDRIFFVAWTNDGYVLLHQFKKTTQKTPKREIERATREYIDLLERGIDYDK